MIRRYIVPVLGFAALALAVPARAQSSGWIDRGRPEYASVERQSYYDSNRAAYDNGYREGLKRGEKDGRDNRAFNYRDEKTFQRADHGYHREFGDLDRYRQSFRTGYVAGYTDGYQRYVPAPGYGRGPGYGAGPGYGNGRVYGDGPGYGRGRQGRDPDSRYEYPSQYPVDGGYANGAFQNGARDGYEKGLEDGRKALSFDVLRHAWYRSGDRHYDRRYGSREQYANVYREGFKEGYDRGYREARNRY